MIKKLFVPIAFLLIFCLLYLMVFNALYVEDPETAAIMRGFYEQKKDTLDVVLIGPSTTYAYFSPCQAFHEQGFTSYDFCTGAQPMAAAKYLITEAEKTQKPKLYIINLGTVTSPLNNEVYIRRVTTNMPWSLNRFQMAEGITAYGEPQVSRKLADYLLVYPYFHNRWSDLEESDFRPLFPLKRAVESAETPYIHRGFNNIWFDALDWHKQLIYDHDLCRSEAAALPREREALLRDLCEFCETLDAEVLFLASPVIYGGDQFAMLNTACAIVEE